MEVKSRLHGKRRDNIMDAMAFRTKSPFPGMDPYLEDPRIWTGVHAAIIACLWEHVATRLLPRYYAGPQERVVLEYADRGVYPDVEVLRAPAPSEGEAPVAISPADPAVVVEVAAEREEPFIEIYDTLTGHRLVTVMEVLSYSNKRAGSEDHAHYKDKQRGILARKVNLVEIDLLRWGERVVPIDSFLLDSHQPFHYLTAISRFARRSRWELYPIHLSHRLPRIPIPLLSPDPDLVVDLQDVLDLAYQRGRYGMRRDYTKPPMPPLTGVDEQWARELLATGREA